MQEEPKKTIGRNNSEVDVSVIIPVYNEIEVIETCYQELKRVLSASGYSYELVFVDDGSKDGSLEKMVSFVRNDPQVKVIKFKRNFGQQKAHWAGFRESRGRVVITFDADLQFDPGCIPSLAAKIFEGYDTAGGIRASRMDSLFFNKIPSLLGRYLINRALKINQKDFGGIKAHSAELIKYILDLPGASDIIFSAAAYKLSDNFVEFPVRHSPRSTGKTKFSILKRMKSYLDVYTCYADKPFQFILIIGLLSFIAGLLLGFGLIYFKVTGLPPSGIIIFFDFFLVFFGVLLFTVALVGEFVVRIYRELLFGSVEMVERVYEHSSLDEDK